MRLEAQNMFSMESMKTMWKSNLSTTTNTEDENKTKNSQEHQEATKIENANKARSTIMVIALLQDS